MTLGMLAVVLLMIDTAVKNMFFVRLHAFVLTQRLAILSVTVLPIVSCAGAEKV